MSVGKCIMTLLSILAFGFLCFVAGIEFKAGNKGVALFQIFVGITFLNTIFDIITDEPYEPPESPYGKGNGKKIKK